MHFRVNSSWFQQGMIIEVRPRTLGGAALLHLQSRVRYLRTISRDCGVNSR